MQPVQEIYPLLSGPARRIVITTHQKPDADAMGSSLALKQLLEQLGHSVTVLSPTNWAGWVNWMPGTDEVLDFEADRNACLEILGEAEWIFCLDYNHFARTKGLEQPLREKDAVKILIDHHQEPDTPAFNYGISNTSKSSTCEMIYDFIVESGHADKITLPMAECIYAGLVGDTGSFRFPSAHEGVHRIVAELKAKGLSHTAIHENLFDNFLENRLRFIGHVLMNRMEILYEYNTALIAIPKSDLLRFRIRTGDTEGLVNYPQSIQGIKLVALVIDRDEERKWSFRSKGDFDCNKFARKYFNGGGHFAASGGHSADSIEQTVRHFKEVLKENASLLKY